MDIKIITDPSPVFDAIKTRLGDDFGTSEKYEGIFYGVFDGDKMAGAFLVKPWSVYCYEVHGGVHPDYWGRGKEVCWEFGNALFDLTPCIKIVATIPKCNRLMIKTVKAIGMEQEGVSKKAFMKNYKIHDLVIFGIQKRERNNRCQ